MTARSSLATTLLANFRTIRFPATEDRSIPSIASHSDWWKTAKVRRAERLAVDAYRDRVRRELAEHDHHRFFDHLEPDPEGGWRLHIFIADDHALSILADNTEGRLSPGNPLSFDPKEFVRECVGRLDGLASDSGESSPGMRR